MTRAPLDLCYEHEMRALPRHTAMPSHPALEARSLMARLRGLKALMDAERGTFAAWIATQTSAVAS